MWNGTQPYISHNNEWELSLSKHKVYHIFIFLFFLPQECSLKVIFFFTGQNLKKKMLLPNVN